MNISVRAKTVGGGSISLPPPSKLRYRSDRFTPCDSLDITIPISDSVPELSELYLQLDSAPFFEGIVDMQNISVSASGRLLKLECRCFTALLLDNEIKPYIYFQLTTGQLFDKYAKPYGVLGYSFPFEAKKNFIQIKKGTSCFGMLSEYCLAVFRKPPYIGRDRILTLDPLGRRAHVFSNEQSNAQGYSSIETIYQPQRVISRLNLKTATESYGYYYGVSIESAYARERGIRRERYFHSQKKLSLDAKLDAEQRLQESERDAFYVKLTIPSIIAVDLGDSVAIRGSDFKSNITAPLYVDSIDQEISEGGFRTVLMLKNRNYL